MKYTLKDFQDEAVRELLGNLQAARTTNDATGKPVSLSLTATTGAGKTVMASALIESLFFGSDAYSFEADPDAVVLWVTDDPSLNVQTSTRFMESSEFIDIGKMEIIEERFDQESFDTQKVYFLNRQKLAVSSNLVKHKDGRAFTLWQTIQNTIADPNKNLYMILDEAHRGIGKRASRSDDEARDTIYNQLIDGADGRSPMPIVLGISATIERYADAMQSRDRIIMPPVAVDPRDVQDSGLLKDTITLLIPDDLGSYEAALLKEACVALQESIEQWERYTEEQTLSEQVKPLMVVQVPNLVSDEKLLELCEQLKDNLPFLDSHNSFAHVLGDREDILLGGSGYRIRYAYPQRVHDESDITILFAKEAVSTGWDCPRAEVLFSLRPGRDKTYITQLIGRMVRTPLARRIEGNEVLNSVTCFLPDFNKATTQEVAKYLTGDLEFDDSISQIPGRVVLTSPVQLVWDESLGADVKDAFASLPTMVVPRVASNPIDRLFNLAGKLALFEIDTGAVAEVRVYVRQLIRSQIVLHEEAYYQAIAEIFDAQTSLTEVSRITGEAIETVSSIEADKAIIEENYRAAEQALTKEVAKDYLGYIIDEQEDEDYLTAKAEVAAIVRIPEILAELETKCSEKTDSLFNEHRDRIRGLNDEGQAAFDSVLAQALVPQDSQITVPTTGLVNSQKTVGEISEDLPLYERHVLSMSETKLVPYDLNELEKRVVEAELAKPDTVAWYRNPSGASKTAVQIPWRDGEKWRSMQPDFIFFSRMSDGSVKPSIIDPHSTHLSDSLGKLRGFCEFAERHGGAFKRIEAVTEIDGVVKYLDLKDSTILDAVKNCEFEGVLAVYRELSGTYY